MSETFPIILFREEWTALKKLKSALPQLPESLRHELGKHGIEVAELSRILSGAVTAGWELLPTTLSANLAKLRNVAYASDVSDFLAKRTYQDLVPAISSTLRDLWVEKYEEENAYELFKTCEEFEPLLSQDPHYRDHFVHQFQVFLAGTYIIDELYNLFSEMVPNIELAWLLASTFHDIGYPVQQLDFLNRTFLSGFLGADTIPITKDFRGVLSSPKFNEYLVALTSFYLFRTETNPAGGAWRYTARHAVDSDIMSVFLRNLVVTPNHGVLGALALLDRIHARWQADGAKSSKDEVFNNAVMSAALAILLHDREVYRHLGSIHFDKLPLAFLLIYCDSIQEWGRPTSLTAATLDSVGNCPSLIAVERIGSGIIGSTLEYKRTNGEAQKRFEETAAEIDSTMQRLRSKNPAFHIMLKLGEDERLFRSDQST